MSFSVEELSSLSCWQTSRQVHFRFTFDSMTELYIGIAALNKKITWVKQLQL